MKFDNGWALVSCLFFLFGLVFIDTKCVYGFMFFVLQFTNSSDEKKKKKNRFENAYVEIQKMYFAFLIFDFAKCVSRFMSPMGFRRFELEGDP
jgi:hypothetical protein